MWFFEKINKIKLTKSAFLMVLRRFADVPEDKQQRQKLPSWGVSLPSSPRLLERASLLLVWIEPLAEEVCRDFR